MKQFTAALAALALTAAPAAAAAAPRPMEPASESVEGAELRGGRGIYWVLPALIVVALLVAILAGSGGGDQPESP